MGFPIQFYQGTHSSLVLPLSKLDDCHSMVLVGLPSSVLFIIYVCVHVCVSIFKMPFIIVFLHCTISRVFDSL